jgi:Fe-S-cluster containining protein
MGVPVKEVYINFPAIAAKTYQRFRSEVYMMKITNDVLKKLKKISSPVKRARYLHKEVNKKLTLLFKDKSVQKHISCRKGCSACCHTQVSVTDDEAELLAKLVENGIKIDFNKLKNQAKNSKSSSTWYSQPFEDRGCVFLDENKECSVYNDRPSVCRTNHVVGDPKDCSTKDGKVKSVQLLNTFEADMAIMAGFGSCSKNGALPNMLFDLLNKHSEVNETMSPLKNISQVFKEL